ncbi:PREDICTED: F-box protein At3g07870-like [Ipomoea nil]|uniref:F-box protein At3g07870-like n=1 Tax=Ipomoea nil TaxID=35883 RepID=UPI000901575D|nr:PREDICTED: F-box protein At3g07870-like [Ipomoea nil]
MSAYFLSMDYSKESQSKKQKCRSGENHPRDDMASLPREVSLDIISRLPITSLMRFRSVCKSWHNLSHDHQLVHLHLSRTSNDNPCLIFHCNYPIRNWLYFVLLSGHDDDDEQVVRRIDPPFAASMSDFNVVGSCAGLLCLSDSLFHSSLFIYNPFTGNHKELPKSITFQHREQRVVSGFGFHSISKQYKVVKIVYYATDPRYYRPSGRVGTHCFNQSDVQVLSLDSTNWRSIGEAPYWLEFGSTGVLVNGRLHWLRRNAGYYLDGSIASFDLAEERFQDIPKPYFGEIISLMVLQGCLSGVTFNNRCFKIWVMKEYERKESWVKQFTIESSLMPRFSYPKLPYKLWKDVLCIPVVRVLCLMKNGELLIQCKGVGLIAYNPQSGVFRHLDFPGLPNIFLTIVHLASLNWIDIAI